jgi:hypothetical protein
VAAADVEAEALKAVGIVVVEGIGEVGEAPMEWPWPWWHPTTAYRPNWQFPEEFALFIGRLVLATAYSTARSSTKQNPRRWRLLGIHHRDRRSIARIFLSGGISHEQWLSRGLATYTSSERST